MKPRSRCPAASRARRDFRTTQPQRVPQPDPRQQLYAEAGHPPQPDRQKVGHRPGAPRGSADQPRGGFLPRALRILGALLVLAGAPRAGESAIERGNLALGEGRYEDAVRFYLEAQERGGADAHLLANLGHAYAGAGDVGRAVLSFERSLFLAARDETVRESLDDLRVRAGLLGDRGRGWRDFHRYLTRREWTGIGLAAAGVLLLALAGRQRFARPVWVRLIMIGLLLALPSATAIARLALERDRAIVLAREDVALLLSPREGSETTGALRPGKVVWITTSHAGFTRVRTQQGTVGWLPSGSVEAITP